MRRFEYVEGSSSKFWEIESSGSTVTTRWGRIGTSGQSKTKSFASEEKATAEHDALVREKRAKGYVEAGVTAAAGGTVATKTTAATLATPSATPLPAAVPTPTPTPPTPPPPPPADPEAPVIVLTEPIRRRAHPRRGGRKPAAIDVAEAWQKIRERGEASRLDWEDSASHADPVYEPLLKEVLARLAAPAPPEAGSLDVEAVFLAVVMHKGDWRLPDLHDEVVDCWISSGGHAFAVEALERSLGVFVHANRGGEPRLASTLPTVNYGLSREFAKGCLGPWAHLRRRLACASDDAWRQARDAAARLRETAPLLARAALAYLFPDEPSWAESDAREVLKTNAFTRAYGALLTCVAEGELLRGLATAGRSTYEIVPSSSGWGGDVDGIAASMVECAGAASVPALLALLERCTSADEKKSCTEALACIGTDESLDALVSRMDQKEVSAAATEAVFRFPAAGIRALAAHGGRGRAGVQAESLLGGMIRTHEALVEKLLPALPEDAARAVEAVKARVMRRAAEATPEELPPILASPPWRAKRGRVEPKVLSIAPLAFEESVVWREGQREEWLAGGLSWVRSESQEARDTEILGHLKVTTVPAQLLRLHDDALRTRLAELLADRHPYLYLQMIPLASERLALALWEVLPRRVGLGYSSPEKFLATFGLKALPGLLLIAESNIASVIDQVLPFRSPRLAPHVADASFRLKSARGGAQRWLVAHPEAAAIGLIPAAVGPLGKMRDACGDALRFLSRNGHAATVTETAARYGAEVAAEVRGVLDFDPIQIFPSRIPKMPAFFQAAAFARPLLAGREKALPLSAIEELGVMLAISHADEPYAGIRLVKEACDPGSLADFGWNLFSAWLGAGAPSKESWAFQALGHLGDDACARKLAALIREWPGEAAHARAVAGLDVLAAIGSDVALMHLNGIAQKVKFKGLQERAKQKVQLIAELRGLSADELADRLVPDLGLDASGSLTLDFGPRTFRVGFDEHLRPFVLDAEGKRLGDLPKPGKADDPEKAERAAAAWKTLKKDARTLASQLVLRLELAMCGRRRFDAAVFRTFFVEHPLVQHIVRRVVWGVFGPDDGLAATFRVAEDGSLADERDDVFELPAGARVGVAHPLQIPEPLAAAWGELFGDYEILQPFRQLGRDVVRIREEERETKELLRVNGVTVPTGKVLGLEQRGWRRGPAQDGGSSWWYEKPLGTDGRTAYLELDPGIIAGMAMENPEQKLGKVTIGRSSRWDPSADVAFGELDPISFSELMRDLEGLRA